MSIALALLLGKVPYFLLSSAPFARVLQSQCPHTHRGFARGYTCNVLEVKGIWVFLKPTDRSRDRSPRGVVSRQLRSSIDFGNSWSKPSILGVLETIGSLNFKVVILRLYFLKIIYCMLFICLLYNGIFRIVVCRGNCNFI